MASESKNYPKIQSGSDNTGRLDRVYLTVHNSIPGSVLVEVILTLRHSGVDVTVDASHDCFDLIETQESVENRERCIP
tara:strand:+ start:823 stop:1056 length:234 start_codon:yes stop_codon:yes gene_type:complete